MSVVVKILPKNRWKFFFYLEIDRLQRKFRQIHVTVPIIANDNHVPQFSKRGARVILGK